MAAIGVLGRIGLSFWKKRTARQPLPPTLALGQPTFTKPTPDDMTKEVESLPPFQRKAGWDAYAGLEVCWQAIFRGIGEDKPANEANPTDKKKWVVDLKHYDSSLDYSPATICCPGIDIEEYPQFKFLHKNELLIVRGRIEAVQYYWVLLFPVTFEFCGKRIE